jgi:uncharacterized membrane protein
VFQLLFKYPIPVFAKGRFVLLGGLPSWILLLLIAVAGVGLAALIRTRLPGATSRLRGWRAAGIWAMQWSLLTIVLILLWQPAITVAELQSQQNIIAVLLDDSRSMSIHDSGSDGHTTRESDAVNVLSGGVLAGLQKKFQVRLYKLDTNLTRLQPAEVESVQPAGAATHIGDGLRELVMQTSDLPVGAVVLLSDGAENVGGIDSDTMAALRNRRLPVHTIGFGKEHAAHDIEIDDATMAPRAIANSRAMVTVSFHQYGYANGKTILTVRNGSTLLASREVTFIDDGAVQNESLFFDAGPVGVKTIECALTPLSGEEQVTNNLLSRQVDVTGDKRRILYVEGEPRWEYKFLRRAEDDDPNVQVVSMLRTTENKIYRQGISNPKELEDGFPSRAEDLFGYDAVIIGSVEAGYFTPAQQELLREFVDRRGGGLLWLGGRYALSNGGWESSSLADLLPTFLPTSKDTFHRDPATAELTAAGGASPITRLIDDPAKNVARWKTLPYMNDYQDAGMPKPGATILAQLHTAGHGAMPLLTTQSYGRGRTAILATSGTWRWQMSSDLGDPSHDLFWQQLLRWLSADSPGRVALRMARQTLLDDGHVQLTATVRDVTYMPAADASVQVHILGANGVDSGIAMTPLPNTPGTFQAEWTAGTPGSYVAEVVADRGSEELGREHIAFRRMDRIAENYHNGQNRDLLEKLSSETGGHYWTQSSVGRLPTDITYSEAGISVRDTKELWDMPIVFLVLLSLLSAEWLLRRKWGIV